jgi:hypothetical protein
MNTQGKAQLFLFPTITGAEDPVRARLKALAVTWTAPAPSPQKQDAIGLFKDQGAPVPE